MGPRRPLFKRSWEVLSERPAIYALATALPFIVCIGGVILAGRLIVHYVLAPGQISDPLNVWQTLGWGERLLAMLGINALAVIPSYLAARGVSRTALNEQKEIETPFGSLLFDMLRFMPAAILYFFVVGIPSFIGGLFLVVPGLLITALFALVIPAGADTGLGPVAAMHRGLALSRRVFGRVLGVYAVLFLAAIVAWVILGVFGAAANESPGAGLFVLLLGLPIALMALAIVNIAVTLLYCDGRDAENPLPSGEPHQANAQRTNAG